MLEKQTDEMERRVEIAGRVRQARRMKDLTQEQTADILGCSRRRYYLIEKGQLELGVTELDLLARKLRIPILFFFDGGEGLLLAQAA